MKMTRELRHMGEGLDQAVVELERMRGGEADALDAGHRRDMVDERGQVHHGAIHHRAGVSVDVLAEESHLAHALGRKLTHLLQYGLERAADLVPAGVRHDAEAAVPAAALHHGNEGRGALGARLRQAIELLDLGKADIDHGAAGAAQLGDHVGQAVQGLRAEYQIDERGPLRDAFAFLARDAPAHTDQNMRSLRLELAPLAQHREHLLLRLLPHRAGVHQQYVGLGRIFRARETDASLEHVRHAGGVVLVHLAAEGFDEVAAGHKQGISQFYGLGHPVARAVRRTAARRKIHPKIKELATSKLAGKRAQAAPSPAGSSENAPMLAKSAARRLLTNRLERDVVVEVFPLAAAGPATTATATAWTGVIRHGLARHASRGPASSARSASTGSAAAAQHLHLVADDLGGIALVALLVLPLAGAQAALN